MTLLTVRSLKKDFGIKEILKDASFSLDDRDKVGLIGTNGSGKSTLLKMIAGLEAIDGGEIQINSGMKIVYLPQQPDLDNDKTVLEQVFADSGESMTLIKEYEELSDRLVHEPENLDTIMERLSRVSQQIDKLAAWDLETNAKVILSKLGIDNFNARVGDLSGGYRKRIAIATALLADPDCLLMDEPTNHLDALSVEWLQSYLSRFRGGLLLITHDRYFLDRVVDTIFAFETGGNIRQYPGNYSLYLDQKKEEEEPKEKKVTPKTVKASPSPVNKKISFKEKKEYEDIEKQIPILEAKKAEIEQVLYGEPLEDFTKITALTEELAQLSQKIDTLTDRWLELAEKLG